MKAASVLQQQAELIVPPPPDGVPWTRVRLIARGFSTPEEWPIARPRPIEAIVWHDMEGSLPSALEWWDQGKAGAHFGITRSGEIVLTCLLENIAWHAGTNNDPHGGMYGRTPFWRTHNINPNSIGVELEGFTTTPYPEAQIQACIKLGRWLARKYSIPTVHTFDKFDGHHMHSEISADRSDPGHGPARPDPPGHRSGELRVPIGRSEMPTLIYVHGRGQKHTPQEEHDKWHQSLLTGMQRLAPQMVPAIPGDRLELAYWSDLFYPPQAQGARARGAAAAAVVADDENPQGLSGDDAALVDRVAQQYWESQLPLRAAPPPLRASTRDLQPSITPARGLRRDAAVQGTGAIPASSEEAGRAIRRQLHARRRQVLCARLRRESAGAPRRAADQPPARRRHHARVPQLRHHRLLRRADPQPRRHQQRADQRQEQESAAADRHLGHHGLPARLGPGCPEPPPPLAPAGRRPDRRAESRSGEGRQAHAENGSTT